MSGEDAVKSLNVHLCFVRRSVEFRTTGAVQLFTKPHPIRNPKETKQPTQNIDFDSRFFPVYAKNMEAMTVESDGAFKLGELLERIYELHVSFIKDFNRKLECFLESRGRLHRKKHD